MSRFLKTVIALSASLAVCGTFFVSEAEGEGVTLNKKATAPIQVGYCQGESYYEFDQQFYYLVKGMAEYGLIPDVLTQQDFDENSLSQDIWRFLSSQNQEGWKVRFLPKAYVSLDEFDSPIDSKSQAERLNEMVEGQGVDLMITMGTNAGLMVKELPSKTPFMNFMSADPVSSGIVEDTAVSRVPGAWAQVDPGNFTRSMSVMYDTFQPDTIGVVYANNQDAYIYSGASELDAFCRLNQVEVWREYVEDTFEKEGYEAYVRELRRAHEILASDVDVFILTTSLLEPEDYEEVLKPFYEARVPVYSINSVADVEYGAMMAVEASDCRNIGLFGADMMNRYYNGEKLEELNQIYQTAPFLVLNYTVARRIGYHPDFMMLCSTSRIYY